MVTNDTTDWSGLLDVALFEANRVTLPRRIKHATEAIHRRMEKLLKEGNVDSISERLALSNALATLADLHEDRLCPEAQRVGCESSQAVSR
jgi:hypothetical protein